MNRNLHRCALRPVPKVECCTHDCDEGRTCPERYGFPTSRRHPRSLADAFPEVRRQSFEPHISPPMWKRVALFIRRRFA